MPRVGTGVQRAGRLYREFFFPFFVEAVFDGKGGPIDGRHIYGSEAFVGILRFPCCHFVSDNSPSRTGAPSDGA